MCFLLGPAGVKDALTPCVSQISATVDESYWSVEESSTEEQMGNNTSKWNKKEDSKYIHAKF